MQREATTHKKVVRFVNLSRSWKIFAWHFFSSFSDTNTPCCTELLISLSLDRRLLLPKPNCPRKPEKYCHLYPSVPMPKAGAEEGENEEGDVRQESVVNVGKTFVTPMARLAPYDQHIFGPCLLEGREKVGLYLAKL